MTPLSPIFSTGMLFRSNRSQAENKLRDLGGPFGSQIAALSRHRDAVEWAREELLRARLVPLEEPHPARVAV